MAGKPLTTQQINTEATNEANASIKPGVTALQNEQNAFDQQQQNYQQNIGGFTQALINAVAPEAQTVSSAYDTAARGSADFAKGMSDGFQHAMSAGQDQADKMLSLGGQTQANDYVNAKVNPGAALTDPFYDTHGRIPGNLLETQGASNASRAAGDMGVAAARGQGAMALAVSKAIDGDKQFQQKIADLYATVPSLRNQIIHTIRQEELQRQQERDRQREIRDNEKALGIKTQIDKAKIVQKGREDRHNWAYKEQQHRDRITALNQQMQNENLNRAQRQRLENQREAERAKLQASRSNQGIKQEGHVQDHLAQMAHGDHKPLSGTGGTGLGSKPAKYPSRSQERGKLRAYVDVYISNLSAGAQQKAQLRARYYHYVDQLLKGEGYTDGPKQTGVGGGPKLHPPKKGR